MFSAARLRSESGLGGRGGRGDGGGGSAGPRAEAEPPDGLALHHEEEIEHDAGHVDLVKKLELAASAPGFDIES